MSNHTCPVCHSSLQLLHQLKFNVYKCRSCQLLHSDASFDHSFVSQIDESRREQGLKSLRLKNFEAIINQLKKLQQHKAYAFAGLEIGSGNGWWLETCKLHKINCTGIEPEKIFEQYHKQKELHIFYGFYPDARVGVPNGYDFIIFNDVFEHIEALDDLLQAVKQDLTTEGLLIINMPMSNGAIYTLSTLLHKFGFNSFLERMWQFNFHSPHINYFNQYNLHLLLKNKGFKIVAEHKLDSIDLSTIKDRISTDRNVGALKASLLTVAIWIFSPFIKLMKPDIKVFYFRKS